jgi:hypothetical protein
MILAFVTPGLTLAESTSLSEITDDTRTYSQTEVDAFLAENSSFDPNSIRAVTEKEYLAIVNKAQNEMKKNPKKKVNVEQILNELNLSEVTVVKEVELNNEQIQPHFITVGSVGFHDYSRSAIAFSAQPHVSNSIPLTTVDQIAGYVTGYSIVPGSNSYVIMFSSYFSETKVKFGQTNVSTKKSIAHYNKNAKMVMNVVVVDRGKSTVASNTIISKPDGTFTN